MYATIYGEHTEGQRETIPTGLFQRAILQAVAELGGNAYAARIRELVAAAMQMKIDYIRLYMSLELLEQREFITGQQGDGVLEQGAWAKR